MMEVEKIKDHPDLVKDKETGAILNVNNRALMAYKRQKKNMNNIKEISQTNEQLKEDINNLKNEIQSLKELVLMSLENKG